MDNRQGSYSINVSFNQIVIFLFAVVLISFITFILGYRAGKNSIHKVTDNTLKTTSQQGDYQELNFNGDQKENLNQDQDTALITQDLSEDSKIKKEVSKGENQGTNITKNYTSSNNSEDSIYFYIQVGAFSLLENAQKYAERFKSLGYFTQISPINIKGKKYFRVQVGRFYNKDEANTIKRKLEKQEGKKFSLKLSN